MLHFRTQRSDEVTIIEFIVPGICDGPEIESISDELHELMGRSTSKKMVIDLTRVRFIEGDSDFHRLARFLETYVHE